MFLDYLTGDFYSYCKEKKEWQPKGNVGLHYSRALEALGGTLGGEAVKKQSTYQSKSSTYQPVLFIQKVTDIKVTVRKSFISHWLFKSVPGEFVVDAQNTWDPHPVNITKLNVVNMPYETMAESDRGPMLALHMNSLCTQFSLDRKYKESVQIFKNFVEQKMHEVSYANRLDLNLASAANVRRRTQNENMDFRIQSQAERQQIAFIQ